MELNNRHPQLDYTCGVIPVSKVDRTLDQLTPEFRTESLNGVARGAYSAYDAEKMHGLPIGVQIVARKLEEERVLAFMQRVEEALTSVYGKSKVQDMFP